ncbi:TetR/AcrR family transcriptional regulator [Paenibacillus physcomitrellae]|uniref:TetR family transcriptional regulator n=1 Tax=Paenibacillus physcomitrellae TaxID=1619311 RepID=A0ABQ1GTV0_9BACL|nr:TetR/AcrR family transcriptional regulator [Paenibacillus physcomitrellae]GGA50335.1 TetR family transcriptional regulator [Paenibacillus physcomitrellae]
MPRAGLDEAHVLQAAAGLADSLGAEAVTLALLAKELNVRPPSLYNHIKGLPDLRIKLAVYGLQMMYTVMSQALAASRNSRNDNVTGTRTGDGAAIYAIVEAYLAFAEEHPGLYELAQRPLEPAVQTAGEPVVELMLEQMNLRGIYGDQAIHAVRGLRSILHGFVSLSQGEGFGLPYAWKESLHYTLEAFLNGLEHAFKGKEQK